MSRSVQVGKAANMRNPDVVQSDNLDPSCAIPFVVRGFGDSISFFSLKGKIDAS
jgi:hypothetical protein